MKAWAIVAPAAPLEEIEAPTPEPTGTEVVIEVTHCGVCHSDLHFWKNEYNMGGGKIVRPLDRGVTLPKAPGHEIAGRIAAVGPEAEGAAVGDIRVVYPWLGCGTCAACKQGSENLCAKQHALGVIHHGGFASHVVVPHPRYLFDPGRVDPGLAATYACSGITAYSAVKKIMPLDPDQPVVLIGAGGLGLATISMLRAFGHRAIVSVDLSAEKLAAAREAGATHTVDGSGDGVRKRILEVAGGPVAAAIDFVNVSETARTGLDILRKGGKLVLVGVAGGELTISLAKMIFSVLTIEAAQMGSLQDLEAVLALANEGKLAPTPICRMPRDAANDALFALKKGNVTGRVVLTDEG